MIPLSAVCVILGFGFLIVVALNIYYVMTCHVASYIQTRMNPTYENRKKKAIRHKKR